MILPLPSLTTPLAPLPSPEGDIRSVLRTILTSREFNSQAAFRAKVKSPFELVASSLRTLGAESDGGEPLMGQIMRMGQPLFQYQAPTGFPDRASNWINSGTLLARMNFSMALAANRIRGTQLDLQALTIFRRPAGRLGSTGAANTRVGLFPPNPVSRDEEFGGIGQRGGANPRAFPKTMLMAALLLGSPDFQRR